jgi:hypothetical protein
MGAIKEISLAIIRPGFTKKNSNPFEVTQQGFEYASKFYTASKNIKENEKKLQKDLAKKFEDNKTTPEERFSVWAGAYKATDEDIQQIRHQNIAVGIMNYIVAIVGVFITYNLLFVPATNIVSMFVQENKYIFLLGNVILISVSFLKGLSMIHKANMIKTRSLLPFSYTLSNFKRWIG